MSKPDLTRIADGLAVAAARLTRWLRAADPAPQLSAPQASALAAVVYSGGIRPSELAALEQVQRPAMARTIAQLRDRRLVERVADPEDGRGVVVRATPAGRALLAAGQRRRIEPLVDALATLSGDEVKALARLMPTLERLIDVGTAGRRAPND